MAENFLKPENYYNNYQGWNLELMNERVRGMKIPAEIIGAVGSKKKSNILVLGSAVPENINAISKIDSFLRPGKVEQDTAVIIDQNMHPLKQHKKDIEWIEGKGTWNNKSLSSPEFPYPNFKLARADMRELPFAENVFDIIISDYTLNYLDKLEDVEATFEEISRTLTEKGVAIVSFRGNEKYSDLEGDIVDDVQEKIQGGVKVHYFSIQTYFKIAQKHGLKIVTYDNDLGTDICVILNRAEKSN